MLPAAAKSLVASWGARVCFSCALHREGVRMEGPRGPGALVQLWFTVGGVWGGGEDAPLTSLAPAGLGPGRWPLSSSLVRRASGAVGPKVRGVGRRRGLRGGVGAARVSEALEPPCGGLRLAL